MTDELDDEYVPRVPYWSDGKREPPAGMPLVELLLGLKPAPIAIALTDDARIDVWTWRMQRRGFDNEEENMLTIFELLADLDEPTDEPIPVALKEVRLED